LENELTVSGERSKHVISEVASKDEELVVMKVENATLVEKLKSRSEDVSTFLAAIVQMFTSTYYVLSVT